VELKDFKQGVETLARFTNQREAEPDPFMVQIGKDGMISLIAGNDTGIAIWRTGITASSPAPHKEGIKSKTLVQAAKVLKGRGVTVKMEDTITELAIKVSAGGSITLPYVERPELRAKPMIGDYVEFEWTAGEFETLIDSLEASHGKSYPDALIVEAGNVGFHRFASTDSYKMWQGKKSSVDKKMLPEPSAVSASFWYALRGFKTNAVTRFYENGVRVHVGGFEFSTVNLDDNPVWPNLEEKYFTEGTTPDVMITVERKLLIGAVKAVMPVAEPEATSIAIMHTFETKGEAYVQSIKTGEAVGVRILRGKPSGRVECSGKYLLDILNAISDEQVYVAWNHTANHPIRVVGSLTQWSHFILAPVVRV
jgi:DNA polymerase III sliding clamp (beta) subunit (PCNA family)